MSPLNYRPALCLSTVLLSLILMTAAQPLRAQTASSPEAHPALSPAAAVTPALDPRALNEALQQFLAATRGDTAAVQRSQQAWERLLAQQPANPLLLSYLGTTLTLKGRDAWAPWTKLQAVEDGLAQIDKALQLLRPEHERQQVLGSALALQVRANAAQTFLALPGIFKRQERGERLLKEVLNHPALADSAPGLRGSVWLSAARQALKQQQAEQARVLAQRIVDQALPQAAAARSLLKELG
ncbi:hypothetical protein [Roseateles sp.]|jgi:hypothetical protein|uniref:hypothetical protein n=1 Tax=Roseateles sp. TaxID=1971397 RepID=UPI0039189E8A